MRDALEANRAVSQSAFEEAFGFGNDALRFGNDALNFGSDIVGQASDTIREAVTQSLDSVENQQYWAGQAITQALGTVKSIGTGGASDNAESMKWVGLAAVGLGAVVMLSRG
ncbi:MAG: hypothetical protein CMP77_02030 [Flavobacterium sp.]|nr:hypothetical protein [Flavobacterium sp.]MBE98738.1 hypothetical protein [Flavobacterium sp.]